MRVVLDGVHGTGDHCGSASLRNLAGHFGWGHDEPTCFGLGAGLGFAYFEVPFDPYRGLFGRPLWLEVAYFEHLGIGHEHREGDDWETAWDRITSTLDGGDPVMCFADIYYLEYYGSDTHFSPHSLLCLGYDEDEETAILGDSEFDEPQELSLDLLREAMTSKHLYPLQNRHLVVTDPTLSVPFPAAARTAITETASYMLDPETASRFRSPGVHGVDGIRALADGLPDWTDLEDPAWAARFAYQSIERRGTGGGAFRRLYARFLEAAAADLPELPAVAADVHAIADRWTVVAGHLYEASEADAMSPHLEAAAEELTEIAAAEQSVYERLRAAL